MDYNENLLSLALKQVGPMARTVSDAAILFSILSNNGFQERCYNKYTILDNCLHKVSM